MKRGEQRNDVIQSHCLHQSSTSSTTVRPRSRHLHRLSDLDQIKLAGAGFQPWPPVTISGSGELSVFPKSLETGLGNHMDSMRNHMDRMNNIL